MTDHRSVTERSVTHDTFVLERTYRATPDRVFAAWAEADAKRAWFIGAAELPAGATYTLDFRVGGHEIAKIPAGDQTFYYDATFDDIVDGRRIVYSSYMLRGDERMSVSVTSVQFRAATEGTVLVLTEHGVYLDGLDKPEDRKHGVGVQLDTLATALGEA